MLRSHSPALGSPHTVPCLTEPPAHPTADEEGCALAVDLDGELHELSRRKLKGRKRRLLSSTHKERRSARLATKESAEYVGAVDKAARVKAAKLNLVGVSRPSWR